MRGEETRSLDCQHDATRAPAAGEAKRRASLVDSTRRRWLRRPTRRSDAGSDGLRGKATRSLGHNPAIIHPLHWVWRLGKRPHHFPIPISIPKIQTIDRIYSSFISLSHPTFATIQTAPTGLRFISPSAGAPRRESCDFDAPILFVVSPPLE